MVIAVTGAAGFIGSHLIEYLLKNTNHEVVALSRRGGTSRHSRLTVKACDLYSRLEIDEALRGCDVAVYLVHSMAPSESRLVQGRFEDFDFLLADNFARAARSNNLQQIVYVSGIVPGGTGSLSSHLKSRFEVEKTLQQTEVPVTTLRCGLVIGSNGSSFKILEKLVDRLPIMTLPRWMKTRTQAIYLGDLVKTIEKCLLHPIPTHRSYDVVHPDILTYRDLLIATMKARKKKRRLLDLPNVPLWLSRFWISLITGVPKQLVYPLVDSLQHEMLSHPDRLPPKELFSHPSEIDKAILLTTQNPVAITLPIDWTPSGPQGPNEVQSVQRLNLPDKWDSPRVAKQYIWWLPRFFLSWVFRVKTVDSRVYFYPIIFNIPLLIINMTPPETYWRRVMFQIEGGILVGKGRRLGNLEFREGFDQTFAIAAIHRFTPSLPWPIYRWTQAILHLWVMKSFNRYLQTKMKG